MAKSKTIETPPNHYAPPSRRMAVLDKDGTIPIDHTHDIISHHGVMYKYAGVLDGLAYYNRIDS